MYKICKEYFIKKVKWEFCNKELNKSYIRFHIKKQHYNQHIKKQHYNDGASEGASETNDGASEGASENIGGSRGKASLYHSTLIVGPSFFGKTYLLLNNLQLIRLNDPLRQIRIITRSPEQYKGLHQKTFQ